MAIVVRPASTGFAQIGNDEWIRDGWDLDRLIIKMQGPKSALAAYLATLTLWSASGVDGNMFLSDWRDDDDPVHPTVDLIYLGRKAGSLPPDRVETTSSLQTLTYSQEIDTVGSLALEVQYLAPTWTNVWIARNRNSDGDVDDPTDERKIVFWRYGYLSSFSALASIVTADIQDFLDDNFHDLILPQPHSEELVPGQYYRNSKTKTLLWAR